MSIVDGRITAVAERSPERISSVHAANADSTTADVRVWGDNAAATSPESQRYKTNCSREKHDDMEHRLNELQQFF